MQVLRGKYNFAKVMIDQIDEATRDQIQRFLDHPAFGGGNIAIMPDCHAGKGSCVGFTQVFGKYVMPQIVGVDIGCGMLAANTMLKDIDIHGLDAFIKAKIPSGYKIHEKPIQGMSEVVAVCEWIGADSGKVQRAIGTLGGGNHFIEVARDGQGSLWVIIHSGSRNFGKRVADYFQAEARNVLKQFLVYPERDLEYIPIDTGPAAMYLGAMSVAQEYASLNRKAMMLEILIHLGVACEYPGMIESVHNYIDFKSGIIRKGAISAQLGEHCIIPFNSAEGSALCVGKGNREWNFSAPHGAGRLMSRSEAFKTLDYKEYQKRLADNGVYSTTANSATLDEAPMAYKPKEMILEAIKDTVEVVDFLKPIYNFKAAEKPAGHRTPRSEEVINE